MASSSSGTSRESRASRTSRYGARLANMRSMATRPWSASTSSFSWGGSSTIGNPSHHRFSWAILPPHCTGPGSPGRRNVPNDRLSCAKALNPDIVRNFPGSRCASVADHRDWVRCLISSLVRVCPGLQQHYRHPYWCSLPGDGCRHKLRKPGRSLWDRRGV